MRLLLMATRASTAYRHPYRTPITLIATVTLVSSTS
jgi:hypothetical protein